MQGSSISDSQFVGCMSTNAKPRNAKRVKDGWELHSYDSVAQGKTIYATIVWKR